MKLFCHYCPISFSNCYILGEEPPWDADEPAGPLNAVIIDPGYMDQDILGFIEDNSYTLRGVLITHDHENHVYGLSTLSRIYETEVFSVNHILSDYKTTLVRDQDVLTIGPFSFEVISVPGHSQDSAVFRIDQLLFTGDALSAGLVGNTASAYGAATQLTALQSKILALPGDFTVLPGHGPPTSLEVERRFNPGLHRTLDLSWRSQEQHRRELFLW